MKFLHGNKKSKTEIRNLQKYSDPLLWLSKLCSGASSLLCFSLRCDWSLTGVYLWQTEWTGQILEKHTLVLIQSHNSHCMSG